MAAIGIVIIVCLIAGIVCGRAGSGLGAFVFLAVALVLFVQTPAGSGLPGAVGDFISTVNDSTTPALNRAGSES